MRSQIYNQNNFSLVFQFLVSKYLTICQLFKTMEDEVLRRDYARLKQTFSQLIGPFEREPFTYSVHFDDGLLYSLQDCCLHLPQHQFKNPLLIQKLLLYVQKIVKMSAKMWRLVEEISHKNYRAFLSLESVEKIQNYLRKIGDFIEKLFLQSSKDEIVLLYLVQNHEFIESIYPSQFVTNLFTQMFSNGVHDAEDFILKQYDRRGYSHLLSRISEDSNKLKSKILLSLTSS